MTIQEKVAEKIDKISPKIEETVIEYLVNQKIKERSDILVKAISKLNELEKQLNKINGKCDTIFYDKDGNKTESMSQKRYEEIEKTSKSIENIKKVITEALEKNNDEFYIKLNGLLGGDKQQSQSTVETKE